MIEEISFSEIEKAYGNENYLSITILENKSMITNNELHDMKIIWNYKKPSNALEIGIRKGFTAQFLMENSPWLKRYIAIDVPGNYKTTLEEQRWEVLSEKALYVKSQNLLDLRILENGSFELHAEDLPKLDFIFIDGDHSMKGVLNDSLLAINSLNNRGFIIWHDYMNVKSVSESLCYLVYKYKWNIKHIIGTYLCYLENNT